MFNSGRERRNFSVQKMGEPSHPPLNRMFRWKHKIHLFSKVRCLFGFGKGFEIMRTSKNIKPDWSKFCDLQKLENVFAQKLLRVQIRESFSRETPNLLSFQNVGISQTRIAINCLSKKRNELLSVGLEVRKVCSLANCHSTVMHLEHVPDRVDPHSGAIDFECGRLVNQQAMKLHAFQLRDFGKSLTLNFFSSS